MSKRSFALTPDLMLRAYRAGLFPMAETRGGERLYWLDPQLRGILPLHPLHPPPPLLRTLPLAAFPPPRRLLRPVPSGSFQVTADTDFPAVITACAASSPGREDTWIN